MIKPEVQREERLKKSEQNQKDLETPSGGPICTLWQTQKERERERKII